MAQLVARAVWDREVVGSSPITPTSIDFIPLLWYYFFMFDKDTPIVPAMTVRHDAGLRYQVDDVRQSTEGYEHSHELGGMVVNYTQLEEGGYPAGTKWSKGEEGFRQFFTPDPNAKSDIVKERTETQLHQGRMNLIDQVEGLLDDHDASLPTLIDPITDEPPELN